MVNKPETSIIVPTRGGSTRLPTLLSSAAGQTEGDFEVIVVVDGDIDGTTELLRQYPDPRVRTVVFPENRGRSAALNAGFDGAHGRLLIRCDDDLELEPDFIAHHKLLHAGASKGVITMCTEAYSTPTPYSRQFGEAADARIQDLARRTPPDRRCRWWSGCVSVTREVFDRVGPYDLRYRRYGWEDVDWGYRLHQQGVPIAIPDGFETKHHGPVTSCTERALRALHSGAARQNFIEIHGEQSLAEPLTDDDRDTAWTRVVEGLATFMTEHTVAASGRIVDRVIDRANPWFSEKLVSLLVESASVAGRKHPHRLRSTF